jgi:hypothetical protein
MMYIFSQISSVDIDHLSVKAPYGTAIITDLSPLPPTPKIAGDDHHRPSHLKIVYAWLSCLF